MSVFFRTLLLLLIYGLALSAGAKEAGLSEKQIKAAYLYKFSSYIEWPQTAFPEQDTPMTIGVLGADDLADELSDFVSHQTINGRAINVKTLKPGEVLAGLHILFVGQRQSEQLKTLLNSIQKQPILIVTESPAALDFGSVINFVLVDEHIRFEISLERADQNGLKISARLLSVAQKIEARRS
ncbi:MAG TPA: YfiR family protein [Cellvibrio sp.]|nr:YfiR family protein [Cellvibrio sp.]